MGIAYHQTPSRNVQSILDGGLLINKNNSALCDTFDSNSFHALYGVSPVFLSIRKPFIYAEDYFDDESDTLITLTIDTSDIPSTAILADVIVFSEETEGEISRDHKFIQYANMDTLPEYIKPFLTDEGLPLSLFTDPDQVINAYAIDLTGTMIVNKSIPSHCISLTTNFPENIQYLQEKKNKNPSLSR